MSTWRAHGVYLHDSQAMPGGRRAQSRNRGCIVVMLAGETLARRPKRRWSAEAARRARREDKCEGDAKGRSERCGTAAAFGAGPRARSARTNSVSLYARCERSARIGRGGLNADMRLSGMCISAWPRYAIRRTVCGTHTRGRVGAGDLLGGWWPSHLLLPMMMIIPIVMVSECFDRSHTLILGGSVPSTPPTTSTTWLPATLGGQLMAGRGKKTRHPRQSNSTAKSEVRRI